MPENNERSLRQPELLRGRAYQRHAHSEPRVRRNPDGRKDSFGREETLLTAQDAPSPSAGFFFTARARAGALAGAASPSPAPDDPPAPAAPVAPAPGGGEAGRGVDAGREAGPDAPDPAEEVGRADPSGREPSGRDAPPAGGMPAPPALAPNGRKPPLPALPNGREPSGRDPSGREPSGADPDEAPGRAPGAPEEPAPPETEELPGRESPPAPPRRGFRLKLPAPPAPGAPPAERPNPPGRLPDDGRPMPGPRGPPTRGPPRGLARGPSGDERGPAPASRVRLPFFTASLICTSRPLMRFPVNVSMASCPSCGSRKSTIAKPRAFPSSSRATMISSTASPNGAKYGLSVSTVVRGSRLPTKTLNIGTVGNPRAWERRVRCLRASRRTERRRTRIPRSPELAKRSLKHTHALPAREHRRTDVDGPLKNERAPPGNPGGAHEAGGDLLSRGAVSSAARA